jgi:hypothetical protein
MDNMERARRDNDEDIRELVELREYDPKQFRAWAFAGMVGVNPDYHCPRCDCAKSSSYDQPNRVTEACSDGACRCHDPWE